jgi:hypothetical protein
VKPEGGRLQRHRFDDSAATNAQRRPDRVCRPFNSFGQGRHGIKTVVFVHGMYMTPLCWEQGRTFPRQRLSLPGTAWPGETSRLKSRQRHPDTQLAADLDRVLGHLTGAIQQLNESPSSSALHGRTRRATLASESWQLQRWQLILHHRWESSPQVVVSQSIGRMLRLSLLKAVPLK